MSRRPPSPPPSLPGYEYERLLGSGRSSDVYVYRQSRPPRRVVIKVLLPGILDEPVRQQVGTEATAIAQLSTHPAIVTIHQAEISEDHRAYLVMEHCSRPHYGLRLRTERITVAEALSVGVQIAGAVETGHRARILHRDIKPANILVTDDNRPVLTDFRLPLTGSWGPDVETSRSASLLWSPPECFADPPHVDVRSDVFSLAATVHSLLAGCAPFEHLGSRNCAAELIHRLTTEPLPPLTRSDVPDELNRALSIAMAKDPSSRYDTALAFGRGLQQIQLALCLPVTQMDVREVPGSDEARRAEDDEAGMHTRIRSAALADPGSGPARAVPRLDPYAGVAPVLESSAAGTPGASAPSSTTGASTMAMRSPGPADTVRAATVRRPAGSGTSSTGAGHGAMRAVRPRPATPADPPAQTPVWPFVTLAAVMIVMMGVGTTLAVRHLTRPEPEQRATIAVNDPAMAQEPPGEPRSLAVAALPALEGSGDVDRATISWKPPENVREGDSYQVRWKDLPATYSEHSVWAPVRGRVSTTLNIPPGVTSPCLEVRTVSPSGSRSRTVPTCLGDS